MSHTTTLQLPKLSLYCKYSIITFGTWNLCWAFHWIQLMAATVQWPWAEAKGTLPKVPMLWHPPVLVIAVWDEWQEDWESGTYSIHSGMSRVFYLPQHRTLSTPSSFTFMSYVIDKLLSSCWWLSVFENLWAPNPGFKPRTFSSAGRHSTIRPNFLLYILYIQYSDQMFNILCHMSSILNYMFRVFYCMFSTVCYILSILHYMFSILCYTFSIFCYTVHLHCTC